jgi:hypothetical protein
MFFLRWTVSFAAKAFTVIKLHTVYTIMPCQHLSFHLISSHISSILSRTGLGLQMSYLHISEPLLSSEAGTGNLQLAYYGMMIFIFLSIRLFTSIYKLLPSPHIMPLHQYASNRFRETIPLACPLSNLIESPIANCLIAYHLSCERILSKNSNQQQ